MERIAVVSKTGMTGYAFDANTNTLEVSFKGKIEGEPDKVYHYAPFTTEDFVMWQAAESKGSWFLRMIKPRVGKDLTCTKIAPEKPVNEEKETA